jgi:hypothetical protein
VFGEKPRPWRLLTPKRRLGLMIGPLALFFALPVYCELTSVVFCLTGEGFMIIILAAKLMNKI